jgi:hypothetical protein
MGLDMYLSKKHYIGNKHRKPEQRIKVVIPKNQDDATFPIESINNKKVTEITEEAAYWRKANAIHKWFVNNVQDGNDDCHEYYVSREQLEELITIADRVIADHNLAPELLPTQTGFFFGDESYDEYYFETLKETKKMLTETLENGDGNFYYQSSW